MKSGLILSGLVCASSLLLAQDVTYNFDPSANFSKYHTYEWVNAENGHPDQLVDKQIRAAVDQQLAAKGFTMATNGKADLQVVYQIAVDQEKQWNAFSTGGRIGGGFGSATESKINVGTLAIGFFDPATKSLLWKGQGTKTLDPSSNAQKNMERMQKAIAKLLKNFPPPTKK